MTLRLGYIVPVRIIRGVCSLNQCEHLPLEIVSMFQIPAGNAPCSGAITFGNSRRPQPCPPEVSLAAEPGEARAPPRKGGRTQRLLSQEKRGRDHHGASKVIGHSLLLLVCGTRPAQATHGEVAVRV